MASTEERKIKIIADGTQVNAVFNEMNAAARLLQNQLKKLPPESEEFVKKSKKLQDVRGRMKSVKEEMYGTQTAMQKLSRTVGPLAGALGLAFGVQTVFNFFKSASAAAEEFEESLSALSAITGAVGEDLEFYRKEAELLGATTTLSAVQAADAYTLIGSKKPELLQSKEALAEVTKETVKLAEAAKISLPEAADAMTQTLNKFDLGASESARVADVLAAAYRNGSVDIKQTAFELSKFGGIANAQKVTVEQSAAAIQVVGKTVEASGTKLRNILLKLATGADETNPAIVGLETALENLGKQQLGTAELSAKFGSENAEAALQLIKNRAEVAEMTEKVKEEGVAMEMAATNTNNYKSDKKALASVYQSLQISIGEFINKGLKKGVSALITFINVIRELPGFISENREVFYALGLAIISLNAANIRAQASTLAHLAVEKGRTIATKSAAAAQWLMNAAMNANPIGIIITLIGGLILAFMHFYRTNEKVRAAMTGLWDAGKAVFEGIRDSAMKILGGVGDLLMGIFTFDADKIKKGWETVSSSMSEVAGDAVNAFKDSYQSELEKANEENIEQHKENAADVLEVEAESEEELLRLKEEKAKERAEKQKEAQEKAKKLREEFNKASIESEKALEDLRIAVMEEGTGKKIAKLELATQRELAAMEDKKNIMLENEILTMEERQRVIDEWEESQALKKEEAEIAKQELLKEKQENALQEDLSRLSEEEEMKALQLEEAYINAVDKEFEQKEKMLEIQRQYAAQKLALLEDAGKGETLQAQKLKNSILRIDTEIADGRIEQERRAEEMKRAIKQEGYAVAQDMLKLGIELLGHDEEARKKNAKAIKAFETGQVVIAGIKEVASIWKGAASLGPIAGPIMGAIQTGFAVARTAMAVNKIQGTKYAAGGGTGSGKVVDMMFNGAAGSWQMPGGQKAKGVGTFAHGGHVNNASFGLIGEAGAEWVGPNWMMNSPKYANIFQYLETERVKGRAFAAGGATAATPAAIPQNSGASADLQQTMQMLESFEEMKAIMADMRNLIQEWPTILRVINDPRDTRDALDVINQIESDSRITR